jgi:hypothetical protein
VKFELQFLISFTIKAMSNKKWRFFKRPFQKKKKKKKAELEKYHTFNTFTKGCQGHMVFV